MRFLSAVWLGLLLGSFCPASLTWEVLNEGKSFRANLEEVEWTGSDFVAVGYHVVLTSPDGLTWGLVEMGDLAGDSYEEIAVGPGVLVIGRRTAVCRVGDGAWQQSTLPAGVSFISAAGNGTQFIALGNDGDLYRSPDGLDWSELAAAPDGAMGLAFGNGKWVSFNEDSFYHSADGVGWMAVNQALALNEPGGTRYVPHVDEVDFSGGLFVATRIDDEERLWNTYATSSDGETWALAGAPLYEPYWPDSGSSGVSLQIGGLEFGEALEINDLHLDSSGREVVIHSRNEAVNGFGNYSELYFYNFVDSASNPSGRIVVVGNEGLVMTSDNPFAEFSSWREVGIHDRVFSDAASDGTTVIGIWESYDRIYEWSTGETVLLKSEDGLNWEPLTLPGGGELGGDSISYVNGIWFLADRWEEKLFTSPDAVTWTEQVSQFSGEVMPMAREGQFGSGVYLSVPSGFGFQGIGDVGQGISSDGVEWNEIPEEVFGAAAFGGDEFKVVQADRVFTSANGADWMSESTAWLPGPPNSLFFFKGRWIAGSFSDSPFGANFAMISNDCLEWQPLSVVISDDWGSFEVPVVVSDLHVLNGQIITSNWPYAVGISPDGVNWNVATFPDDVWFESRATKTLPLGDCVLGLGPNQMVVISSPVASAQETKGLALLKPGFLEMAGTAGKEYRLMESSSFDENDWSAIGDWRAVTRDGEVLFWGADSDAERNFYRVEER